MAALNARAELKHEPFESIARDFLSTVPGLTLAAPAQPKGASRLDDVTGALGRLTLEHLRLVLLSLLLALALGAPLGLLAARRPALGQVVLSLTGLAQTIPTIALLCFLIPLFGVGTGAALVALVLYGLLPIVRGVVTGLSSVDKRLLEVATVLGMTPAQRLLRVELPLASVAILNGVQVSAVTSVGTATLAALIGGGGYGSLIVSGLALNDMRIVLAGAVPSAVMALGVHFALEGVARLVVPRGLRLRE
jgi:osmoprotectant transport system permease protein